MHRDWITHRKNYIKGQMVIRWREYTVKQKLARMFFKKMVLLRFKNYTFQKTHAIPYQFWSRYRQILFFKILKYHTHKSKRRQVKANILNEKQKDYMDKLLKKSFVGLLENVYNNKKKKITDNTVWEFRKHQLSERVFNILKIAFLNSKKNKILKRVAHDFRQERVAQGRAYVNKVPETDDQTNKEESDRILLQKVYTSWLQYTLDNFIKVKVLKRFQLYRNQRQLNHLFQAWRLNVPSLRQRYYDADMGQNQLLNQKHVNFDDQSDEIREQSLIDSQNYTHQRYYDKPDYLQGSSDLFQYTNDDRCHGGQQTPMSGMYVESSATGRTTE